MWFVVSKKRYERQVKLAKARREQILAQDLALAARQRYLDQAQAILKSTEREKVLTDLEEALNLVQAYQRALDTLSAADPNITRANDLLRAWDKVPESKTYLGMRTHADWNEHMGEPPPQVKTFMGPRPEAVDRWKHEEKEWGDEAYGTAYVRIEAEAVEEGNKKEPGYTRAHLRFVDLDAEDPPILAAAKATTEEAGFPEPDTLD
jgi:multidrug efflux pump subunit AcrA (membrane-fusion protein)